MSVVAWHLLQKCSTASCTPQDDINSNRIMRRAIYGASVARALLPLHVAAGAAGAAHDPGLGGAPDGGGAGAALDVEAGIDDGPQFVAEARVGNARSALPEVAYCTSCTGVLPCLLVTSATPAPPQPEASCSPGS